MRHHIGSAPRSPTRTMAMTKSRRLLRRPLKLTINVSIHSLRTVVLDYGELLAYWFTLHGCSMLDRGSRPVLFHDSLARFTTFYKVLTYVAEPPTRACTGGSCGMLDRAGHPYFHPYLWSTLLYIHTCVVFRKEWYRKTGKEVIEGRPLLHPLLGSISKDVEFV